MVSDFDKKMALVLLVALALFGIALTSMMTQWTKTVREGNTLTVRREQGLRGGPTTVIKRGALEPSETGSTYHARIDDLGEDSVEARPG